MPAPTARHAWVESLQGPITLCPDDRIADWPGILPGEGWPGTQIVDGVVAAASVGDGVALLLQASDTATWTALSDGGGALVQDVASKGDAAVDAIAAVPDAAWVTTPVRFRVGAARSMLFDGAWRGPDARAGSAMSIDLAPGTYRVSVVGEFAHGAVIARYVRLTPT